MEFLHPPEGESNRVILLLVVARNRQSRLVWYDWNADMPLPQAHLRPNKIPLHPDEQPALLLIPLKKNAAFILVCEKRIVLIRDILTGGFNRYFHHLAFEQEPQEPGASQRRPIWVQWARPMRSMKMRPNEENIILCREDGIVQYMVIDHSIKQMIDSNHSVGRLGININTSFAAVDLGLNTEDLLIVGGDESDGGLWGFPPRQSNPNQRGIIPNWTPINDFAVVNVPISRQNAGTPAAANNVSKGQQRLFACSGRGKHGAISEIRYGVEATRKITTVGPLDELKDGVLGIWALHGFYGDLSEQVRKDKHVKDVTYIVLSHPLRTYLLQLWLKQVPDPGNDSHPENVDEGLLEADVNLIGKDVGLDFCSRTIAAGRTLRGRTIQITETSLRATCLPFPSFPTGDDIKEEEIEDRKPDKNQIDAERSTLGYTYVFQGSRILTAFMLPLEDYTYVFLAVERDGQYYVEFGTFATEYRPGNSRIPLHAQPSCLSWLPTQDGLSILVGTLVGALEVYLMDDVVSGLATPAASTIRYGFTGPFGICDSIATIERATTKGGQPLLVCGLRDGTVEILILSKGVGMCEFTTSLDFYLRSTC